MSILQEIRNDKKESLIDIQSKVVEYQVLSEKSPQPLFELKNMFIENNSPELLSQNIEQTKKK